KRPCVRSRLLSRALLLRRLSPHRRTRLPDHRSVVLRSRLPLLALVDQFSHLRDRDHRKKANEQKQQRQKQSDAAEKRSPVPTRGKIHTPRRWHKVPMQTGDDDNEPLQPHAEIHRKCDEKESHDIVSHPLCPKELRDQYVEKHQRPKRPPVRTKGAIR